MSKFMDSLSESVVSENVNRHMQLVLDLNDTYRKKNSDYGDSFSKSLDKRGLVAAIVRMDDKMERFETLSRLWEDGEKEKVSDESITDTLLDLANYAIMTAMWIEQYHVKSDKIG